MAGKGVLIPVLNDYLGTRFTPSYRYMPANPEKGYRRLKNTIVISYRDGPAPNTCIHKLIGSDSPPHPWSGPVVVFKYEGCVGDKLQ